jgi:hypothetical protein
MAAPLFTPLVVEHTLSDQCSSVPVNVPVVGSPRCIASGHAQHVRGFPRPRRSMNQKRTIDMARTKSSDMEHEEGT